jgi:hypothetical protein
MRWEHQEIIRIFAGTDISWRRQCRPAGSNCRERVRRFRHRRLERPGDDQSVRLNWVFRKRGILKVSRIKFVSLFVVSGLAYIFSTRLILNQMPASLFGSDFGSEPQAAWQSAASLVLSPVKFVLMGPLRPLFSWMLSQEDADPPPPMLLVMFVVYWTILALVLHYFLVNKKHLQGSGRQAGESTRA